jgi:hypothetical protein
MSTTPKRIQLKRSRGWRKPEGAICVGRPSKWGNPFRVGSHLVQGNLRKKRGDIEFAAIVLNREIIDAAEAVAAFRTKLLRGQLGISIDDVKRELRGHDLACWCALDQPCHADILLAIANK